MALVHYLLSDAGIPAKDCQKALDRIFSDPGIPVPNSTSSFWLRTPHPTLSKIQSPQLPSEADVVIIGSGITAASIARSLLKDATSPTTKSLRPSIVILEARDVCSGATGRNGGHILETAEEFLGFESVFGLDAAKQIMKFRLSHRAEMLKVAEEYGLTEYAQARNVQFLSVHFDEDKWQESAHCINRFKECMPDEAAEWRLIEKDEIPKEFSLPRARGIVSGPAGAMWPYRFVTGVLDKLRQEFPEELLIETNTPVTEIHSDSQETTALPYTIVTSRGTIKARHVIHCTNAHVGHLVPGLRGRLAPLRGQMSAQNPGSKFVSQGETRSWLINYNRGFDYLTQLPQDGQPETAEKMMFGGGFAQSEAGGVGDLGISTDSELSFYAEIHLSGALSAVFGRENWGSVSGPSVEQMWTGNMSYSADGLPWVGKLPPSATLRDAAVEGKGGEWISTACCGEGMVQAWLSGKALATMLLRHDGRYACTEDLSWFPKEMLVTDERIQNAVFPRNIDEYSQPKA
ncbi:FAD dependent oxidoreductase-domain-containing protein [Aspergillus ambiguus]|uniref:NAD(P)/FAD-dependent oxidoreductase n=1 Tax=Aspergillus ambiguus TaxID=176160 RepID=UPI003CCD41FE